MNNEDITLTWSSSYSVAPTTRVTQNLPGDKILLPPSALEQLLTASTVNVTQHVEDFNFDPFNPYSLAAARAQSSRSQWQDHRQQLPHPLTFRLVNPRNGNVVHAGIREFSAEEGEIGLSPFLLEALGLRHRTVQIKNGAVPDNPIDFAADTIDEALRIVVHAKQLAKGTYVRLRPLEAGYNPEDWKSLLERHLRDNFTTLTVGEILSIPGGQGKKVEDFRFLIDKFQPSGDGICVVDTDLEVDIEALNEEQARETLRQIMDKAQRVPGSKSGGSSPGGILDIWNKFVGQVIPGDYVDYQLPSWDRSQGLEIELIMNDGDDIDLFVSPLTPRQRALPRGDEHVFGNFDSERLVKRIRMEASNIELDGAEALNVSIGAFAAPDDQALAARSFSIQVRTSAPPMPNEEKTTRETHSVEEEQCKNCRQWVPSRSMMLHENFCLRNNVLCSQCQNVFKKDSVEWNSHWHCPNDDSSGNKDSSKTKHDAVWHTRRQCPSCSFDACNLPSLAVHRTSVCPGKIILCQFCHLSVSQDGDPLDPSPEQVLTGLTAHELADGARTTNCHLCNAIVRLRDMSIHLKHHDLSRQSQPIPRICRNANCGRTLDGVGKNGEIGANSRMGQGPGNDLGLCSICFGPLYVSMHDPEGKAMRRRVERRYISQLITGCGKSWCANPYCKIGRVNSGTGSRGEVISTKEALPMVKPLMETVSDRAASMYFCVDESSQRRRVLSEMLAAEGQYRMEWCVAGCEATNGEPDVARSWMKDWAPKKDEQQ